jgi:hypothetical protein
MMTRLILSDPVLAVYYFFWLPKRLACKIGKAIGCPIMAPGSLFYEVCPHKPGPLPNSVLRRWRLRYLAGEDAALSSAFTINPYGRTLHPWSLR